MKIPQYVIDILNRSEYCFLYGDVGYTLIIHKATPYTRIDTFKAELERLISWVNRQYPQFPEMPTGKLNRVERKTRYNDQTAIVTIYDPVMKHIENHICYNRKRR